MRILVIDGSAFARNLVHGILNVFQCKDVREAASGGDALEMLRNNLAPDMIITDYLLPDMEGTQLIRKIRAGKNVPDPFVPIIMLTSFSERNKVEAARDAGANEVLIKPFSAEGLRRHIAAIAKNPRPFIETAGFTGPDRRRRETSTYQGSDRRRKRGSIKDRGKGAQDPESREE